MKNALILHGAGNNSQGNWFPWLKVELEKKDYKVWVPDLPNSDIPNLSSWLKVILGNKDWVFNMESVIIGHSAGATFILRLLEKLPRGLKINKAVLVSGPVQLGTKSEYFPYKRDMVKDPSHWDKIRNSCNQFYFFHSDNDPYQCGIDQGRIMQKYLRGELIFKPNQGHFNLETGSRYKEFPKLLEKILMEPRS